MSAVQDVERICKPDPHLHLDPFEVRVFHVAGWQFVVGITHYDKELRRRGRAAHAYVKTKPKHLKAGVGLLQAALALDEEVTVKEEVIKAKEEEEKPEPLDDVAAEEDQLEWWIDQPTGCLWWSQGSRFWWEQGGPWTEYKNHETGRFWISQEATGKTMWM